MAKMSQIQIRFIEEEDRLLLSLNTNAAEEFRFWLTRRFTHALLPLLQSAALSSPPNTQKNSNQPPPTIDIVYNSPPPTSDTHINTQTPINKEKNTYPLGNNPLLLTQATLKTKANQYYILAIKAVDNRGIEFILEKHLLHMLMTVLQEGLKVCHWNLDLDAKNIETRHTMPISQQIH